MKNRINDYEAELLLAGRTPEGRPDFADFATSVASFRSAAFETVPRPSAALAARLGLPQEALVSALVTASAASSRRVAAEPPAAAFAAEAPRPSVIRGMRDRVAGLGLAAKIAAGMGALALGVTVAGAAGALPGGMQDVFDDLASVVTSVEGDAEVVIVYEKSDVENAVPEDRTLPEAEDSDVSDNKDESDGVDGVDEPLSGDAEDGSTSYEESEYDVGAGDDDVAETPASGTGSGTTSSGSGSETSDSGSGSPAADTDSGTGIDFESGEPSGDELRGP